MFHQYVYIIVGIPIPERNVTQWVKLCQERFSLPPINMSTIAPLIIRGSSADGAKMNTQQQQQQTLKEFKQMNSPNQSSANSLQSLQLAGNINVLNENNININTLDNNGIATSTQQQQQQQEANGTITPIRRSTSLSKLV